MSLLRNITQKFFGPADTITPSSTPTTPSGEMGKEDMIDFLGMDDNDSEEKEVIDIDDTKNRTRTPKEEGKETSEEVSQDDDETESEDEEKDELKELEEEIEEPTEEQLELMTPVRRREILKKYPNLFKDFPYLEKAYYREQQFTELLPTIEDARKAVQDSKILRNFEQDLSQGNMTTVLKAVREDTPEAFFKMVDNYLPMLAQVDEKAYHHVLGNITKHTIVAMVQEAQRSSNDTLKAAAQILNQFVFGTSEFVPPSPLAKNDNKPNEKELELQRRQTEFNTQQLTTAVNDLNTRVNNTLKNTVEAHIDPKGSMSDYIKSKAIGDVMNDVEVAISNDSRFRAITDRLWGKVIEGGFKREDIERVKSAYLAKAKTLLPSVIKKARNEALRGMGKRVKDDDGTTPTSSSSRRGPVPPGQPRSNASGKITKASDIPGGMSTLDFLNSD